MSDKKNTNANKAETKTTDTAPYMKKDKQTDYQSTSSKSDIVIPLMLLLVSAIVIVATFYNDEDNTLVANNNPQANSTEDTVSADSAPTTQTDDSNTFADKSIAEVTEKQTTESVVQHVATTTEGTSSDTKVSVQDKAKIKATSSFKENKTQQHANNMATKQANSANNQTYIKTAYTPYQRNTQAHRETYQQSMARAQEQAKKHNEMIQQRRQAYEKEMQSRRQQHEAAMKAREEKRAKMFTTQKDVFQRGQQDRIETNKKLQEIHKRISDLYDEIHQIMRESRPAYKNPAASQVQNSDIE